MTQPVQAEADPEYLKQVLEETLNECYRDINNQPDA